MINFFELSSELIFFFRFVIPTGESELSVSGEGCSALTFKENVYIISSDTPVKNSGMSDLQPYGFFYRD